WRSPGDRVAIDRSPFGDRTIATTRHFQLSQHTVANNGTSFSAPYGGAPQPASHRKRNPRPAAAHRHRISFGAIQRNLGSAVARGPARLSPCQWSRVGRYLG